MNSSTKIILKSQTGYGAKYSFHKMTSMFQTVLKLALINGYDDQYRIRNKDGTFIDNSNLLDLIHHAMSVGKNLAATNEFVDLLAEAEVEPEWIVNDNIKTMLRAKLMNRPVSLPLRDVTMADQNEPPQPQVPFNPITTGAYWGPEKVKEKRTLATYSKPPALKLAPRSLTPPTSPPSPFKKSLPESPQMPSLDRMDVPPASPPKQMPTLQPIQKRFISRPQPPPPQQMHAGKRSRDEDDDEDVDESQHINKKFRGEDLREQVNKSMSWELPDEEEPWE